MVLEKFKVLNNVIKKVIKDNVRLGAAEAPKYINIVKDEVKVKVSDVNNWYTRILGLDEVRLYQERVVALQEKLLTVQERRRSIGHQLTEIRKKSNGLQDQIHKTKRQDDLQGFLDLMKEETEILTVEREITNNFNECDREEREVFTAFTNAVRDSHEKQRAQLEYTKYFGLVLSLVGSFLTFFYSTFKKQDLKRFIESHLVATTGSSQTVRLKDDQQKLSELVKLIDKENQKVLSLIKGNHKEMMSSVNDFQRGILRGIIENHKEISNMLYSAPTRSPSLNLRDSQLEEFYNSKSELQKIILCGCATIVGFIMIKSLFS